MLKNIAMLLFAGIWGLVMIPGILTASDEVRLAAPGYDAVETIEPVVSELAGVFDGSSLEREPEEVSVAQSVAYTPAAPVAGYAAQPAAVALRNYTVTIHTTEIVAHDLSYNDIYQTKKLIYGHNTENLLGSLRNMSVGTEFTITDGGVKRNYRVAEVAVYAKTADGNLENDPKLMARIMRTAMGHAVALFTCTGTPYGNGDASHRLVVYADEV